MARNQASSSQIKDQAILSQHIAPGAINETHLAIDWIAKSSEILQTKKVVDYVQGTKGTVLAGASTLDLSGVITLPVAATSTDLGVVVTGPNNKVILTEATNTSKYLVDALTSEVIFGRIAADLTVEVFTVVDGEETAYVFPEDTDYSFQYPARFTLQEVTEMFAANEKFVDGAADVTTRLDVTQVAKDIFGGLYSLNKDGLATVSRTIVEQIADLAAQDVAIGTRINGVDAEIDTLQSDLAALTTEVGEVDVAVQAAQADATTAIAKADTAQADVDVLEGVVTGVDTRVGALEAFAIDADARLDTLEANLATAEGQLVDVFTSIGEVRDDIAVVNEEIRMIDTRISSLRVLKIDKRFSEVETAGGVTIFVLPDGPKPAATQADVYYNGMLQMIGIHYTENVVEGEVVSVQFAPELIAVNDVVQLRWF